MERYDILRPMLELSTAVPAAVLCFLPMKNHLNDGSRQLLLWGVPALLLWSACGGRD